MNRSGTDLPADIASNLNVGPVEGLPSGGSATYRFIDGVATYNLPAATSVNAATQIKLNLGGFTNTATPGSYTSTIRTYDNASPPALVDSATTNILTFAPLNGAVGTNVVVDPSLTLGIAGMSSSCNGATPTAGSSSTSTSVNLGRLSTSGSIAAQNLTINSNATSGATIFGRSAGPLSDGSGHNIPALAGATSVDRAAFPSAGNAAFGYLMQWFPDANTYIGLQSTRVSLMQTFAPGATTQCIAFRAQPGSSTPAGSYSTSVIYTAVPRF